MYHSLLDIKGLVAASGSFAMNSFVVKIFWKIMSVSVIGWLHAPTNLRIYHLGYGICFLVYQCMDCKVAIRHSLQLVHCWRYIIAFDVLNNAFDVLNNALFKTSKKF
jgi:hypothetical protein